MSDGGIYQGPDGELLHGSGRAVGESPELPERCCCTLTTGITMPPLCPIHKLPPLPPRKHKEPVVTRALLEAWLKARGWTQPFPNNRTRWLPPSPYFQLDHDFHRAVAIQLDRDEQAAKQEAQ